MLHLSLLSVSCEQKLGRDGAVPLSNSLSLADRHRMRFLINKSRGKDAQELCPFKHGTAIYYTRLFYKLHMKKVVIEC